MCRTCIFHLDFIDSHDVYRFEFLFLCFYALCAGSSSAQLCLTLCDRGDCSLASPLSVGFPRQGYSSGLPFPSPGDRPNPGIKPGSPESPVLAGRSFTIGTTWEALGIYKMNLFLCEGEGEVAQSCPTLCDSTVAYQALPSMGFSRQEYWSRLPFHANSHYFSSSLFFFFF